MAVPVARAIRMLAESAGDDRGQDVSDCCAWSAGAVGALPRSWHVAKAHAGTHHPQKV